jgi:phosphoserine phosphatase
MDGTLINGRLVFTLGDKYGLSERLKEIMAKNIDGYVKTAEIASLWKGIKPSEIVEAVNNIPLMEGAEEIIDELKRRDYIIGIISDSYTIATEQIFKKFKIDFNVANELEVNDGLVTGNVRMPLGWERINCSCKLSVCKRFHLERMARTIGVGLQDSVAVGDTKNDLCMIETAGIGIAFNPKDEKIMQNNIVVKGQDLKKIMSFV